MDAFNCPKAALFDLDDTLAYSFQPPTTDMVGHLSRLLSYMPIGIVTAAGWPRIREQFVEPLHASPYIGRLYIFPNSSAECLVFKDGNWVPVYGLAFTDLERESITQTIREAAAETGLWGERAMIIDRGPQVAFAAIGLDASLEEKRAWDPDQAKRKKLQAAIMKRMPEIDVLIGGMTTIDITKKGINKAYGVRWLAERLSLKLEEMIYVGDAFYEGGNDAVVIPTGVQWRAIEGPEDTLRLVADLLAVCNKSSNISGT